MKFRYALVGLATLAFAASGPVDTSKWTAADDHQNMMDQLGIKALRPGPSGNESAPNHANYDEATANPFPNYPDALTMKNGKKVTTPAEWAKRRAEIVMGLRQVGPKTDGASVCCDGFRQAPLAV